ncbi:MAG TPA: FAD-dependent monooxygenase [Gammaproteobacteria bacterium]|nr:FAD-dependent monooxygenase [Gammaproteobacteria bacterium]
MQYDIAIIGGGMVGASFALALQNTAFRIALIDAAPTHTNDHRLIALNKASCDFFKNLNLWSELKNHAASIHEVHVSTRGSFGTTRLLAKEMHVDALGHVIPARDINHALYTALESSENIDVLRGAKLTALSQTNSDVDLALLTESGQELITAKIVMGADGTFSTTRELLDIPAETIDYHQKALVTITDLNRDHHHIAYERFLSNGAIAMLPLTDQRAATIWSGNEKQIDELLALSDDDFLAMLQKTFGFRLGKLMKTHSRFSYPLKYVRVKNPIKNRVLLMGNAAHTVHPIAAQGLNLALYEVDVLTRHFSRKSPDNLSLENCPDFLTQQKLSLTVSHRLTQLFSLDFFPLTVLRQMGMMGLDVCLPLKKRLGKRLLGQVKPI